MKTTRKNGMRKAIAFLFTVISLFSCTSCDPDLSIKSQVTISRAENVTTSSATVVAYVVPNGDATVSFQYQANNSAWVTKSLPTNFSGSDKVKVTLDLYDLQPSTLYNFTVTAVNAAGSVTSSVSSFTTDGLTLAVVKIKSAENVKVSTASLKASVVANQDNTSISFEYQTVNSTWVSKSLGSTFSGSDSAKVNLDLSDLQANTLYNFRVRVNNKAGEVVSDIFSFTTYAVADYDGNLYHTVTIGTQTWLKENFKGIHYANGDVIANVLDQTAWANQTAGAYCYYDNDLENGKVYGALYNWYAATDSRSLIVGYHTPSYDEWDALRDYLGGMNVAGLKLKETGLTHWYRTNAGVTNSTDFTALPGGARTPYRFTTITEAAMFWTGTIYTSFQDAHVFSLEGSSPNLQSGGNSYVYGQSIRLVKN